MIRRAMLKNRLEEASAPLVHRIGKESLGLSVLVQPKKQESGDQTRYKNNPYAAGKVPCGWKNIAQAGNLKRIHPAKNSTKRQRGDTKQKERGHLPDGTRRLVREGDS